MELRDRTVSGRTSGINRQVPVDLNPAAANLGVAVFIQASANSFANRS
jgi:hypothetical protein